MSLRRRLALIALPAALLLGALGALGAAVPVSAATPPDVVVSGHCSKTSLSDLQVQREDSGKLSIDFGVDMARHSAGIAWKVNETDNGAVTAKATTRTIADGSFSITRLITPKPGANHIVATARNRKTGETCRLSATL